MNLPSVEGGFKVILADPPWSYNDKGFGKRPDGAESGSFNPNAGRYDTMTLDDICALPVADIAAKDCALFMWATSPLLPEALRVMESWGFKFTTVAFVWCKTTKTGKWVKNLGQWTMGNVEICLLGKKGAPKRLARNVRQLVVAERTRHSAKPLEVHERIETLMGDVSRLEMFARAPLEGWQVWGNDESLTLRETEAQP